MPVLKFGILLVVHNRLLAAIIIMNVGRNFTEMTTSTFESSSETTILVLFIIYCYDQSPKAGIAKGFNFSIVNVALVANHIALITASLYDL